VAIAAAAGVPGWALVVQGVVLTAVGTYLVTRPEPVTT